MTASSLALVRQSPASIEPFARAVATSAPRIVLPDPIDEAQAEERWQIIRPLVEYKANAQSWKKLGIGSKSQLIRHQAKLHQLSARTLQNLLKRYWQDGRNALARKTRTDSGQSRYFAEHREAAYIVAFLRICHNQHDTQIHRALTELHAKIGIARHDLPSRETIRKWLASCPPALQTYALRGRKAYQDAFSPYLSRDYSQGFSNAIWVSDHMIHDAEVWNDCFGEAPWGAPIRLRYTSILDWHSRMVVGSAWCWDGSSASIATALRNAIALYGFCLEFYCDNGKDYLKVTKGAVPAHLLDPAAVRGWQQREIKSIEDLGILARVGTRVRHCIVRHPQSKHVERFFSTMHQQFDRSWEGYTGGAPHLRSDKATAAMSLHRKALRHGQLDETLHPRASVFIAAARQWIEEYNHAPHSGQGMEGRSPAQVFAEDRNPDWTPARPTPADLAILLSKIIRRKVQRLEVEFTAGIKRTYTYFDQVSRDILHDSNGSDVLVSYDENDLDAVAILSTDGHFLTWAREKQLIGMSPRDPEQQAVVNARIGESMADRRHLEKRQRETIETISRVARAHGALSPVEMMERRRLTASSPSPSPVEDVLTHKAPRPTTGSPASPMTPAELARSISGGITE